MMRKQHGTKIALIMLLILFSIVSLIPLLTANPIPVWPDPQPDYTPPVEIVQTTSSISIWLFFIFLLDFGLDIIIMYAGLFLLDFTKKTEHILYFQDFSRTYFIGAVFIISLIGLFTELFLGLWIGGVLIILGIIFLSFYLVSHILFRLSTKNSILMGSFGFIINAIVWSIVFIL